MREYSRGISGLQYVYSMCIGVSSNSKISLVWVSYCPAFNELIFNTLHSFETERIWKIVLFKKSNFFKGNELKKHVNVISGSPQFKKNVARSIHIGTF